MRKIKRTVVIVMLVYVVTGPVCSAGTARNRLKPPHPTALELLDKYAETQDRFQSFISKVELSRSGFSTGLMVGRPWKARYFTVCAVSFDKNRARSRSRSWGKITQDDFYTKDKPYYKSELWDGENHFRYTEVRGEPVHLYIIKSEDKNKREGIMKQHYSTFSGYFYPRDVRIDRVLRKARGLSVRRTTEKVSGSLCYVIDGIYEKDKYTIWIDPQHGYNIAKAVVERPRSNVQGLQGFRAEFKNFRFKKIDDKWVPVSANLESRSDYNKGHYCTDSYHFKVTEMVFNPDHDALGSFVPDDIKDGTKVPFYTGSPNRIYDPQYVWSRQAKFVADRKGHLMMYEPDKGILPVIKTLPRFKMFKLKFEPDETKDKMILLCFVDIKQAPQEYVLNLAERTSNLAEKEVLVIFVDASGSEKKQIDTWAKRHSITVPVGRLFKELLKEIRQAWGIKTLPRLVLADRNHVIVAEGFGIGELNERIKEGGDAKD